MAPGRVMWSLKVQGSLRSQQLTGFKMYALNLAFDS